MKEKEGESRKNKGILLMAYGSPERDEDVEAYYTHIRGGRKPTAEELENLGARYKKIGGRSPLLRITNSAAKKLEEKLHSTGTPVRVYVGMKHWHPYISETFDEISKDGTTEILAIALAPHYSKMSIGSYRDSAVKANEQHGNNVKLSFIDEWHLDPVFIEKWNERILEAVTKKFPGEDRAKIFFLFSAHSLPEKILTWNDPYKDQLLETSHELASKLGLPSQQYGFAFQSAGHTSEPWLGPDILDKLTELGRAGWKNVLAIPIGFVSDHLEILFDIDIEAKELAQKLGFHLERTESFNDSPDFIEVLESVVSTAKRT
jgi:protoporphyrin/coproporphyrin ferrochelatase